MHEPTVTSGFLIEKTFSRMCRDYLATIERDRSYLHNQHSPFVPRRDVPPGQMPKQYRGLMREPIQGWLEIFRGLGPVKPTEQELEASLFLTELTNANKADDDFIFSLEDAQKLMQMIGPPVEREIVWARRMEAADPPPPQTMVLGYEPSSFYPPSCQSAIAEWRFFAWWLCDIVEMSGLMGYHEKLNKWGLFDTPTDAERYLEAYRDYLGPEEYERDFSYYIVEVRINR